MMGVGKMSENNNGGPAFPFGQTDIDSGQLVNGWGSEGMTLRDYFAAKALSGMIAQGVLGFTGRHPSNWGSSKGLSKSAYEIADAMLAERAK